MNEKQWICGTCGAGLGLIRWNGNGVPQLMLYRHAVDLKADAPAEVEVLGPLMGKLPVGCDACGEVTVWWPSVTAFLSMLDDLNGEQIRQFAEAFLKRWP